MNNNPTDGPVICAWCSAQITRGNLKSALSHGICLPCMAAAAGHPIADLSHVPPEVLDALPYGAIQLTGDGVITAYSRAESELSGLSPDRVIGKNFFRQVAPCTAVREFQGALERFARQGRERPSETALCFHIRARGKTRGSGNGLSRRHGFCDAARASCAIGAEAVIVRKLIAPPSSSF